MAINIIDHHSSAKLLSSKHKITTENDGYLFNQVNNLNIALLT